MSLQVSQIPNFSENTNAWGISFLVNLPLIAVGVYLMMRLDTNAQDDEQAIVPTRVPDPVQG